jgi:hypothetical protein
LAPGGAGLQPTSGSWQGSFILSFAVSFYVTLRSPYNLRAAAD